MTIDKTLTSLSYWYVEGLFILIVIIESQAGLNKDSYFFTNIYLELSHEEANV